MMFLSLPPNYQILKLQGGFHTEMGDTGVDEAKRIVDDDLCSLVILNIANLEPHRIA